MATSAPALADSASIAAVVTQSLTPQAITIDREGVYPESVMHELGAAGAFASLGAGEHGLVDAPALTPTLDAVTQVARVCGATAFCCWCQGALTWYLRCTDNTAARQRYLTGLGLGTILGGTALSNPMKHAVGLEKLRLTSTATADGWEVSGMIPWVSNVEQGHPFAVIFATPDGPPCLAVVSDELAGLQIRPNDDFEVMAGTATVSARFDQVHINPDLILSNDATVFMHRIRPGFVLIQAGMGIGLLQAAIDVMTSTKRAAHPGRPGGVLTTVAQVTADIEQLRDRMLTQAAAVASDTGPALAETVQLRLDLGEAVVRAASAAQLMAGAPGLRRGHRAVRLLREAAFYGVLTPSVRQLSYMQDQPS